MTIKFGRYPQASKNESSLIEWLVLKNDGSKALLISKYAIDCKRYHTSRTYLTWETCTLRKWLNGTFISNAFSHEEQAMILSTPIPESANKKDRVFLLNAIEAKKYFSSNSTRQCQGTAYCYARGAYKAGNGNCRWWLRSKYQKYDYETSYVGSDGCIDGVGYFDPNDTIAVRPALWIDFGS